MTHVAALPTSPKPVQPVRVHRLNRGMIVPAACFAIATFPDRNMLTEAAARKPVVQYGNIAQMIARTPAADPPRARFYDDKGNSADQLAVAGFAVGSRRPAVDTDPAVVGGLGRQLVPGIGGDSHALAVVVQAAVNGEN